MKKSSATTATPVTSVASVPEAKHRATSVELLANKKKVLELVRSGFSRTSLIAKELGMTSDQARAAIATLIADGKVFQGGDRRFSRYATTAGKAEKAYQAAKAGKE